MLKRLYHLDHLYGLLLTFGLALVVEGLFRHWYGALGNSYPVPDMLRGGLRVDKLFYRTTVFGWLVWHFWLVLRPGISLKTKLGSLLRAGTETQGCCRPWA